MGAEFRRICTEAGMYALRERRQHVTPEGWVRRHEGSCIGCFVDYTNLLILFDKCTKEIRLSTNHFYDPYYVARVFIMTPILYVSFLLIWFMRRLYTDARCRRADNGYVCYYVT